MTPASYRLSGSRSLMLVTTLLITASLTATAFFNPFKARRAAKLAEKMNNSRQIKLAMEMFALDHDGQYPSLATGKELELAMDGKSSNDYFRQLFASKYINSERIFWVDGAKVCNKAAPDDIVSKDGEFQAAECLKAGDCGWAYLTGQKQDDLPGRPQILDAYLPGTTRFDRVSWDEKVAVVFLDGSARAVKIDPAGKLIQNGEDLLSAKSAIWKDSELDPLKLLVQPLPAGPAGDGEDAADKPDE